MGKRASHAVSNVVAAESNVSHDSSAASTSGAPVRYDFGVGLAECDACSRFPILNRGCGECQARLCSSCFETHVCGTTSANGGNGMRSRLLRTVSNRLPEVRQRFDSAREVTVE